MCFGSKPKAPDAVAAPAPMPPPPSPVDAMVTEGNTKQRLERLKFGLASTIKTSPKGVSGTGADLTNTNSGLKKTLGA